MDKRALLAIVLSLAILLLWSWMVPKPQNSQSIDKQRVVSKRLIEEKPSPIRKGYKPAPEEALKPSLQRTAEEQKIVNLLDSVEFRLNLPQGYFDKIYVFPYKQEFSLENLLFISSSSQLLHFKRDTKNSSAKKISIVHEDEQKKIIVNLNLTDEKYIYNWQITFVNKGSTLLKEDFQVNLGKVYLDKIRSGESALIRRFYETDLFYDSRIIRQKPYKQLSENQEGFKAIGFRSQYLCAILVPFFEGALPFVELEKRPKEAYLGIVLPTVELGPQSQLTREFSLYLGPQDATYLDKMGSEYNQVIYYGKLDGIAKLIAKLLRVGFSLTRNWGLAIILISSLIFLVFYPLSFKQMKSLRKMQQIQPEIAAMREQHKNNPQRLNKETLELYRKHKINPLGGCLPMLFQIPVFFALYLCLMRSVELKGAQFLWIKDLSNPDRLFKFPMNVPILGQYFNLLPILMAVVMYFQQKISSPASSGATAMADQQKIMKIVFPIMFGIIFYTFPSGLVLYWFTNSLLTFISQWKAHKAA